MSDDAIVHLLAPGLGSSYYTSACGLNDHSIWVTMNESAVTCEECIAAQNALKKKK